MIGFLVANTSLRHDDILRLTIPQINIYADKAGMLKIGAFGMVGKKGKKEPEQEHTTNDAMAFVRQFL